MKKIDLTILSEAADMPALQAAIALLPHIQRHLLREAFKKRDVKRNGTRIAADEIVREGDALCLYIRDAKAPVIAREDALSILLCDDDYIVVDKRQGVPVQGALSLEEMCTARFGEPVFACHRLDVMTGGLVLLARHDAALQTAIAAFAERRVQKTYRALVRGVPNPPSRTLHGYLRKDEKASKVRIFDHPAPGALSIETRFSTKEVRGDMTLLDIELITGRTHQIRAHLSHIGHPIVGDDKYGDRAFNRAHGMRRQCLWSVRLVLWDGRIVTTKEDF